jgi:hypothetical protein
MINFFYPPNTHLEFHPFIFHILIALNKKDHWMHIHLCISMKRVKETTNVGWVFDFSYTNLLLVSDF